MISSIKTLAIQLMVGVAFAACSSSDDSIIEQKVNPTEPKTYTMIVQATKGDDATTRGLELDGNTLNVKWNEGEKVWVLDNNLNILGSLTADASNNATTTLRGTITTSSKPVYLNLYLHNYNMVYTGQTGVLLKPASGTDNSIESNYDYARTDNISYNNYSVDETTSTLTVNTTANFVSHQAIVKFSLFEADGTTPIKPTSLTLTTKSPMLWFLDYSNSGEGNADYGKTLELSGLSGTTNDIYVAISSFIGKTMTLTATTANGYTYTYTKSSNAQLFTHGKYYAVKVKMQKSAPAAAVAVDLGLSSGTKWANMNVGATSESDYGLFFAWGETTGYAGCHDFGWTNYKWSAGSKDGKQFSKYVLPYEPTYWGGEGSADNKTKLDLEDDAAHANWGGSWRMPTYAEVNELLATETDANYTWTWTSVDGHNGYRITNKSTSATIFLPAAGYWDGTSLTEQGNRGLYWTSSLFDSPRGLILYFSNMTTPGSDFYPRSYGFTVRPVCP